MSLPVNTEIKEIKSALIVENAAIPAENPLEIPSDKNANKELEAINKEVEQLTLVPKKNDKNTAEANRAEVFVKNDCKNPLQYLMQCYETSSSDDDDDDNDDEENINQLLANKRGVAESYKECKVDGDSKLSKINFSDSDNESDDSDSDSDSSSGSSVAIFEESSTSSEDEVDIELTSITTAVHNNNNTSSSKGTGARKKEIVIKAPGELDLDDLPPVPPLPLDLILQQCEMETFLHMGHIKGILGLLVTIEALPHMPAYNMETILYVDKSSDDSTKKPIGAVFDVIGQVTQPIYVVRFNTTAEIEALNINIGMQVYCPPRSPFTKYVFVKELLKHKGSDASWIGDVEIPSDQLEFSDDEEERRAHRAARQTKRQHSSISTHPSTSSASSATTPTSSPSSLERYQSFESKMNRFNSLDSHIHHVSDAKRGRGRVNRGRGRFHGRGWISSNNCPQADVPPPFNPRVPPPGYRPSGPVSSGPSLNIGRGASGPGFDMSFWRQCHITPTTGYNSVNVTEFLELADSCYSIPSTSNFTHPSGEQ